MCAVSVLPSAGIQHDSPGPGNMRYNCSLSAVHRHRADALVDIVAVINSFVYPVISDTIRSPKICVKSQKPRQDQHY